MPTPPRRIAEVTREQIERLELLRANVNELEDLLILAIAYAADDRALAAGERAESARQTANEIAARLDVMRAPAAESKPRRTKAIARTTEADRTAQWTEPRDEGAEAKRTNNSGHDAGASPSPLPSRRMAADEEVRTAPGMEIRRPEPIVLEGDGSPATARVRP